MVNFINRSVVNAGFCRLLFSPPLTSAQRGHPFNLSLSFSETFYLNPFTSFPHLKVRLTVYHISVYEGQTDFGLCRFICVVDRCFCRKWNQSSIFSISYRQCTVYNLSKLFIEKSCFLNPYRIFCTTGHHR